jgi:hypothetical protein
VLYLDRPFVNVGVAQVWVGRFGYSDLKEAALSGAAFYGSWIGFSLPGGVFQPCRSSRAGLIELRSEFSEPLETARGVFWSGLRELRPLWAQLGRACCGMAGFAAEVGCSCGGCFLLRWGARKELERREPLDDAHGPAAEWAFG